MSTSDNESVLPELGFVPATFYEQLFQLVHAFEQAEQAELVAGVAAAIGAHHDPMVAKLSEVIQPDERDQAIELTVGTAVAALARLVALRMTEEDPSEDLIQSGDPRLLAEKLVEGLEYNAHAALAVMLVIRSLNHTVGAMYLNLAAVNPDDHRCALRQFGGRILQVAAQRGVSVEQVIRTPALRAQVYRGLMGPDRWEAKGGLVPHVFHMVREDTGVRALIEASATVWFERRMLEIWG